MKHAKVGDKTLKELLESGKDLEFANQLSSFLQSFVQEESFGIEYIRPHYWTVNDPSLIGWNFTQQTRERDRQGKTELVIEFLGYIFTSKKLTPQQVGQLSQNLSGQVIVLPLV